MKKFFASIIVLLTVFTSVFAYNGIMSGEEDLRVSKTKWFDIIYPARSEKAAILLYENADRIYEEIGQSYGYEPEFRLPVVICPAVEQFNGYYSSSYGNHIVLYDTAMVEELAVFTDTFLNLFKHECIHAYTFNMKNSFWKFISNVFGDSVGFNVFVITNGLAEGATVSGESALGEGRLNDAYATQMVKQAKIEEEFPNFFDIQGAAENYPANSYYYFNGAFNEWLQQQYGMEKYAKFWYYCCNVKLASQKKIFKKVYGIKIKDAWKLFKHDYKVPEVASNPVKAGLVKDFFESDKVENYSLKNECGALYSHLTSSKKGIAYLDESCSKVYFVSYEDMVEQKSIKPKELFQSNVYGIKFSKDGQFLAVNEYDYSGSNVRAITKIYNMNTGDFYTLKEHGFYESSIVQFDNDYYVIQQGYETPEYTIKIDKLNFDESGKVTDSIQVSKKTLPLNVAPFSFTDMGNGTFAYIKKSGLEYSIDIMDLNLNLIDSYKAPKERMTIRYLSVLDDTILFSWATPDTMPRLGSLNLEQKVFSLQKGDISGGVYYPVEIPENGQVSYIGNFYRQNRLLTGELKTSDFEILSSAGNENVEATVVDGVYQQNKEDSFVGIQPQLLTISYEPFNNLPFYGNGTLSPICLLSSASFSPDFYNQSYPLYLGVTYQTDNPWDSGALRFDAGYGLATETGALNVAYTGSNGIGTFSYSANGIVEFNPDGWKKGVLNTSLTLQYPVYNGYLVAEPYAYGNYGKSDSSSVKTGNELIDACSQYLPGAGVSADNNLYMFINAGATFGFTNVKNTGSGKYEIGGLTVASNVYYTFWNNTTTNTLYYNGMDIELYSKIYIPRIFSYDCEIGSVYNLPSHLLIDLFPSTTNGGMLGGSVYSWAESAFNTALPLATVSFETLLFGYDVQKTFLLDELFLSDIQITAGYSGLFVEDNLSYGEWRFLHINDYAQKFASGKIHYDDYANIRLSIDVVPNIGRLANYSLNYALYAEVGLIGITSRQEDCFTMITFGITTSRF